MKKLNDEVVNYIIKNCNTYNVNQLAEILKISRTTIIRIIKDNDLEMKRDTKYFCDDNYFDIIDNDEKSYWLGFLFADGYVRMHQGVSAELRLKLSIVDKEHIELFKKSIKSTHVIKDIESVVLYKNKKSISLCSTFGVYNKKIVTDLFKIGCVNKKSMIIEFPDINNEYFRHFIRGYFDGDGCMYTKNGKLNHMSIVSGSLIFLEQIKKILYDDLNVIVKLSKYKNIHKLNIYNKIDLHKIYEYFYKNSFVFLKRKKNKFDEFIDINFQL